MENFLRLAACTWPTTTPCLASRLIEQRNISEQTAKLSAQIKIEFISLRVVFPEALPAEVVVDACLLVPTSIWNRFWEIYYCENKTDLSYPVFSDFSPLPNALHF